MTDSDPTIAGPSPMRALPTPPELGGLDPRDLLFRGLEQERRAPGSWQPPAPWELSRLLPQYRIESLLGRGGMGAVYRGFQEALQRPVAIKLLPSEMAADGDFVARFQREARMLAKLHHPGIVDIYGFGQTSEGHLYFVMEYVNGTDLSRIIRSSGLNPAQAVEFTLQTCEALRYAHGLGLIHRDIKPANILVTRSGRAKLADFGLARPMNEDRGALTLSGVALGTPAYMAPEQREGNADHRSDIYAIGVLLYEMLTGIRPEGVFDPPSVKVNADIRLDRVVIKAMQHEPENRYQQIEELRSDVENTRLTPPPEPPHPAVRPRRKAILLAAGAFGLIAAAGFAANQWKFSLSTFPRQHATVDHAVVSATTKQPLINSLGMKFVPVPGTGILMCIHETRRGDYATYDAANPGLDPSWKKVIFNNVSVSEGDDHPVVNLNWADARAFCAWLSKKEGRTYRLPTDREWSLAVGIGELESPDQMPSELNQKTKNVYPWGQQWPPPKGAGNFADTNTAERFPTHGIIKDYTDGYATTAPVMSFTPNKLGIYDLGGNVLQWCEDWYDAEKKDGLARGSGWFGYGNNFLLSSCRYRISPERRYMEYGFRCVLENGASKPAAAKPTTNANPKRPWENSLGMKFVAVSAAHVLFSIWDTRVQDYALFLRRNDLTPTAPEFAQGPTHPAVNMTWGEAVKFCEWLTKKERWEGRIGHDDTYRLPTDTEWSQAAGLGDEPGDTPVQKSGKIKTYPWGDQWPPPTGAGNYAGEEVQPKPRPDWSVISPGYNDGFPHTSPVGQFAANRFGLSDVGGNVWQLCQDRYSPSEPGKYGYVLRGASWNYDGTEAVLRSSQRSWAGGGARGSHIGFRCVLALAPVWPTAKMEKTESSLMVGLVARWTGDGDASDTMSGLNGTIHGNVDFTEGLFGKAFRIGDGGFIEVPDSPALRFTGDTPATISVWAKRTNTPIPFHILGKREGVKGGGTGIDYQLGIDNAFPGKLSTNKWTFWTLVNSGRQVTVYMDGNETAVWPAFHDNTSAPFRIGAAGEGYGFAGLIDDVRIYNRALSTDEIHQLASARPLKAE